MFDDIMYVKYSFKGIKIWFKICGFNFFIFKCIDWFICVFIMFCYNYKNKYYVRSNI